MYWDGFLCLWMHRVGITGYFVVKVVTKHASWPKRLKTLLLSDVDGDEWLEGLETPSRVTLNK
jgi:hypothetical protein